jgi:hypothetical protein
VRISERYLTHTDTAFNPKHVELFFFIARFVREFSVKEYLLQTI